MLSLRHAIQATIVTTFASVILCATAVVAQTRLNPSENCRCGRTFRKAVCPQDVPEEVSYRPNYAACGNKAAILMRGAYLKSFSVVVRDSLNRDRFPLPGSGYGSCSKQLASSVAPPKRCSAFKAASETIAEIEGVPTRVVCFPESGRSKIFRDVRRLTIKVKNSAATIRRFCLNGPRVDLN